MPWHPEVHSALEAARSRYLNWADLRKDAEALKTARDLAKASKTEVLNPAARVVLNRALEMRKSELYTLSERLEHFSRYPILGEERNRILEETIRETKQKLSKEQAIVEAFHRVLGK